MGGLSIDTRTAPATTSTPSSRPSIGGLIRRASSAASAASSNSSASRRSPSTSQLSPTSSRSSASSIHNAKLGAPLATTSDFDEIEIPPAQGVPNFTYDRLIEGKIRLFKLCLNDQDEPLAGRLLTADHVVNRNDNVYNSWGVDWTSHSDGIMKKLGDGSTGYDVISYAWGPSRPKFWLYLSTVSSTFKTDMSSDVVMDHEPDRNGWIPISANLHNLLLELRRRRQQRFLWIDQICIRQHIAEQSLQVPIMREIYINARTVQVWLGVGTDWERYALTQLPRVVDALENAAAHPKRYKLNPEDDSTFTRAKLPAPADEFWSALGTILDNGYWSRLWCLQEAVVNAHAPVFALGDLTVEMELFQRLLSACETLDLKTWILSGEKNVPVADYHGFDSLAEIRALRGGHKGTLLSAIRRRNVTVPSDAVLGMLGMVDQTVAKRISASIAIPTKMIYVTFAKHYLRHEMAENLLNHVSWSERLDRLPTWCPNFAAPPETFSLGSRWLGRVAVSDEHREQMFRAGGWARGEDRRNPKLKFSIKDRLLGRNLSIAEPTQNVLLHDPRQMTVAPDTDVLRAPGMYLDTIVEVIDCNPGAHPQRFLTHESMRATLQWDEECLAVARHHLPRSSDVTDVYARTLCANRVSLELTGATTLLADPKGKVDFSTPYVQLKDYMDAASDIGVDEARPAINDATKRYASTMYRVTQNRRFFATAGGRIGLGSSRTQPGDQIAVFFYCPTPYVLREKKGGRSYEFIGEAYVHGLMYGEALDMLNRGQVSESMWIIE